jgi:flagellar hook-basal body complex protein FliE
MAVSGITAAPLIVTPSGSPPRGVSAQDAARAYGAVDSGATPGSDFGGMLARAMDDAVQTGHAAEAQAMQAISGNGSLTEVVQAVSRAEIALQTTTAIRDRVIQAYQDIMKMPI